MKRGEVWWINFDPSVGGEIQKIRPAIIVSNNAANRNLNRVQVVPLTSNISRVYPSDTLVTVLARQSKAMADQLTTVSKERMTTKIGTLSEEDIKAVDVAIKVQLGLID